MIGATLWLVDDSAIIYVVSAGIGGIKKGLLHIL